MEENLTAPLIEFNNACVSYNGVNVLKNVNLQVLPGEVVYLIGHVGSGKSTLLRSFYADAEIIEGTARVFDFDLPSIKDKQVPYLRRKMGMVFQDFKLLTDRSVFANLEFVLRATDTNDKSEIESRINEVLEYVGMGNKGYKMPHELSGGEQQRIVMARAMINHPQVLLADEPTGNLDPKTGQALMELIYQVASKGRSVVMATHNMRWVKMFPGRVLHCQDGLVTELPKEELEHYTLDDFYNL